MLFKTDICRLQGIMLVNLKKVHFLQTLPYTVNDYKNVFETPLEVSINMCCTSSLQLRRGLKSAFSKGICFRIGVFIRFWSANNLQHLLNSAIGRKVSSRCLERFGFRTAIVLEFRFYRSLSRVHMFPELLRNSEWNPSNRRALPRLVSSRHLFTSSTVNGMQCFR